MDRFVPTVAVFVGFLLSACGGGARLAPVERFPGHDPAAVRDAAVRTLEEFGFTVDEASDSRVATSWVSARDVECPPGDSCQTTYRMDHASSGGAMARVVLDLTAGEGAAGAEVRADFADGTCRQVRTRTLRTITPRESRAIGSFLDFDPYPSPRRVMETETRIECGKSIHSTGWLERSILERIRLELAGS